MLNTFRLKCRAARSDTAQHAAIIPGFGPLSLYLALARVLQRSKFDFPDQQAHLLHHEPSGEGFEYGMQAFEHNIAHATLAHYRSSR